MLDALAQRGQAPLAFDMPRWAEGLLHRGEGEPRHFIYRGGFHYFTDPELHDDVVRRTAVAVPVRLIRATGSDCGAVEFVGGENARHLLPDAALLAALFLDAELAPERAVALDRVHLLIEQTFAPIAHPTTAEKGVPEAQISCPNARADPAEGALACLLASNLEKTKKTLLSPDRHRGETVEFRYTMRTAGAFGTRTIPCHDLPGDGIAPPVVALDPGIARYDLADCYGSSGLTLPRGRLGGTVVVVGAGDRAAGDVHITPLGEMAGPAILLNAVRDYVRTDLDNLAKLGKAGGKLAKAFRKFIAKVVYVLAAAVALSLVWSFRHSLPKGSKSKNGMSWLSVVLSKIWAWSARILLLAFATATAATFATLANMHLAIFGVRVNFLLPIVAIVAEAVISEVHEQVQGHAH
ncbi:MAG: hypothetical protein AAF675_10490 [Pseudomonadota bacterium]